ncbi:MAG: VWA domain-containing protein [Desulfobulbaceae bacterium]|nr:VWA domain-containing protein [Desulfobulbaceae bacterium]
MYILTYPWLLLLLLLPLLVRFLSPSFKHIEQAIRVPRLDTIGKVLGLEPHEGATVYKENKLWQLLHWLLWAMLVVALARPQLIEPPLERILPSRDVLLLVDLSGSMETNDFSNKQNKEVNRLDAVKEVLGDFLSQRDGDRVGLIVFGNSAFVQIPFTQDLEACRTLLSELQVRMAGPKTAFGDAIGLGISLFKNSDVQDRLMIALTDGNDTGSRVPPAEAGKIASDNEITIHVIAIGDPLAVGEEQLDEMTLRAVAKSSGGKYFHADDQLRLQEIYKEIDKLEPQEVQKEIYYPKTDLYHLPLGLFLLSTLLFYGLRLVHLSRNGGSNHD